MIKAGKLTEPIVFQIAEDVTSQTGNVKKRYVDYINTRCELLKSVGNEAIEAKEIARAATETIKIRSNVKIDDTMRAILGGNTYLIAHIYLNRVEQSYTIKLNKLDT